MPARATFQKTYHALKTAIHTSRRRHTVISSNLSNLSTPYYQSKDIDFAAVMARTLGSNRGMEMKKTHPDHLDLGAEFSGRLKPSAHETAWNGFNRVNIDEEMGKLIENNLIYRTSVEMLMRKLNLMREVIREGGR